MISSFTNCSKVLQTVDLKVSSTDQAAQQQFQVIEKTLTHEEAKIQNGSPYPRFVIQNGRGLEAKSISEETALRSNFPNMLKSITYTIGKGDTLTFSRLIDNKITKSELKTQWPPEITNKDYKLGIGDELTLLQIVEKTTQLMNPSNNNNRDNNNNNSTIFIPTETSQNIIEANGRIGSDGSILLLEVGRLEARNKTLNELRSEVRNILIRNGSSPRFQLEIVKFRSQRAYLTINSSSRVIALNDQQTDLRDVLSSAGVGLKTGVVTHVKLQRNKKTFNMKLRDIFNEAAPKVKIQNRDHIFVVDSTSNTAVTNTIVGEDGNIVLAGVGKVKAAGRTLESIREEVSSRIEKLPNSENAFQLEISSFSSQKALLIIPGKPGGNIPITNKSIALDEILTENGLAVDGTHITKVHLHRGEKTYQFTLDYLLNSKKRIYLEPKDRIEIKILPYKPNKVFVVGGVTSQIINIDPSIRQSLADVLFTPGGVLNSPKAQRSEVYLLRGTNPVTAFHLNAQDPTRLIVADTFQLRPNDILFVSEQPISSFNRTLAAITPLRILLRDIQNDNLP